MTPYIFNNDKSSQRFSNKNVACGPIIWQWCVLCFPNVCSHCIVFGIVLMRAVCIGAIVTGPVMSLFVCSLSGHLSRPR